MTGICIYLAIIAFTGGAHRRINVRLEFHFSGKQWRSIWRLIGLGVAFVGFFFQAFRLYDIHGKPGQIWTNGNFLCCGKAGGVRSPKSIPICPIMRFNESLVLLESCASDTKKL